MNLIEGVYHLVGELESLLTVYFGHSVCSPWKLCFLQVIDSCCLVNYVCKLCPATLYSVVQSRYSVLSHDTSLFVKNLEDGDRETRQLVCYFRSCSATLLKEHAHFTTGISRVHLCHLYSSGTWLPYTVLSFLSVKLDPAHSTKLVSIIVYFCNPSQESLDLCKPKSA